MFQADRSWVKYLNDLKVKIPFDLCGIQGALGIHPASRQDALLIAESYNLNCL